MTTLFLADWERYWTLGHKPNGYTGVRRFSIVYDVDGQTGRLP